MKPWSLCIFSKFISLFKVPKIKFGLWRIKLKKNVLSSKGRPHHLVLTPILSATTILQTKAPITSARLSMFKQVNKTYKWVNKARRIRICTVNSQHVKENLIMRLMVALIRYKSPMVYSTRILPCLKVDTMIYRTKHSGQLLPHGTRMQGMSWFQSLTRGYSLRKQRSALIWQTRFWLSQTTTLKW